MKIQRGADWYKPYTIEKNGISRDVVDIVIYEINGKEIVRSGMGYLSDIVTGVTALKEIEIPTDKDIKLKRKKRFDGEVFVVTKEESFSNKLSWVLYIPNELVKFKRVSRQIKLQTVVDRWESKVLGATIEVYRHDFGVFEKTQQLKKRFEEIRNGYHFRIEQEDIEEQLELLGDLQRQYKKELQRIESIDLEKLGE